MQNNYALPPTFRMQFSNIGSLTYELRTSQVLWLPPDNVFPFFEDPKNLFAITPDWLDFKMIAGSGSEVFEGAEFDYTIRWFGFRLAWKSRIVDYQPPHRFADIQIAGPYRSWKHLHTFEAVPEGTVMKDTVTYRLPALAFPLHRPIIRKQLEDIFTYRAVRIAEWAGDAVKRNGMEQ